MAAQIVVVAGATGGLGTSTFAALLADACARDGAATVLVDLTDRGGIEVLLGIERRPGVRWADLSDVRAPIEAAGLADALPRWRGVEVLGPDRRSGTGPAVVPVLTSLIRARDLVVVDHPVPASGLPPLTVLDGVPGRADVVLLVGQDVVGVASALALLPRIRAAAPGLGQHLVLRGRRRARVAPVEAAHLLDLPVRGVLPAHRGLPDAVDRGLGPVVSRRSRLGRTVRRVGRCVVDG